LPWKETGPVKERLRLVQAHETGRYTVTGLAELFGVRRQTAYEYINRYAEFGPAGLEDRSHAAHTHPNQTPEAVVQAVIREKLAHPTWGPAKLFSAPDDPPEVRDAWPATSTRGLILSRAGLTRKRKRRNRAVPSGQPFSACEEANDVWCADFKGWFRTKDGQRCDPLTVTDAYSRMLLCCQIVPRPDHTYVRSAFETVFRTYGLPQAIRTDNGTPFASVGAGGLTRLSAWWVKLGINLERIKPGHPEQNGRHERMHLTLKQDCCLTPADNALAQQLAFDAFRRVYNHQRPHQALDMRTPLSSYQPSLRPYPAVIEDPCYPADAMIRRVRSNGEIRWKGNLIFLSEALISETVAITETLTGYAVHFGPVLLGNLDARQERLVRPSFPQSAR
jgi:transposase InsO family protein